MRPRQERRTTRFQPLIKIVVMLLLTAAVTRGQSALDGFDPNANGMVHVIVVQPDGKILLGGDFTTLSPNGGVAVPRNHIARLNPDGTLDPAFNPNANDIVYTIAVQPDGKVLVGGAFTNIGGQTRNRLARLDASTGVADSFAPSANFLVVSITVQADGRVVAGGDFTTIDGQTRNHIARLNTDGTLDAAFNPNANDKVESIVVQANGKMLVGGLFTSIGGQTRSRIARLDAATGLIDSFNPNANGPVYSIAVQADGKILAAGNFFGGNSIGGQMRNRIARLDPTTGLADSWDPNANSQVESIAVQADGKILAGGFFNGTDSIGGQTRNFIARLDPTTGAADSFDPNANGFVLSVAVQADGKILTGGSFNGANGIGGQTRNRIARLETDGRLDQTLDLGTVGNFVIATTVQPDGKILIGGRFTNVLGAPRNHIARLNKDGTLDTAFDPNANADVFAIAVQTDGKILVGGYFFGAGSIGGQARNRIARLDAVTGAADSFDPNASSANTGVVAIAVQADGKVLAGGDFINIGGQTRHRIARLDAVTGAADSFDPNANGPVYSIATQPDGKILAGGFFTGIGVQTRRFLARLDALTGLPDSFDPNVSNTVNAIAVQADGKVLVGGDFVGANSLGGQARNHIGRVDGTTGMADSFDPNANSIINSIALQADGKVLAGGSFTFVGGQTRSLFTRLTNDSAALQDLVVSQTAITWTRGGSSPQFARVTFEYSTDNVSYAPLGSGTASGSNWTLAGLNLPIGQTFYIRARGFYRSGNGASESIQESVRNVFLNSSSPPPSPTPPTPTPTPTPTLTPTPTPSATTPPPSATPTPTPTATTTPPATPTPTPTPGTLGNISTRLRVLSGDNALIGGLIATGTASKRVIIRAIGPSLTGFGVPGALANPTLDLFQGSTLLFSNDDWNNSSQQVEIAASGLAPNNAVEAAIIWTLAPGQNYTAVVRGINGTTGIGVVEAFDLDQAAASKLGNISTRGFVDVDDNVMIAGLIAGPGNGTSLKVLVRALGPTLSDFGVAGALANPTLDLVNSSGTVIRSNDNWKDDPQQRAAIEAAGLAPNHDEEAALVETVAPGAYTAVVRGSGRATGVGLVEAYNIP